MDLLNYEYDRIEAIAKNLLSRTKIRPKLGIICGSGLGGLADQLTDSDVFAYEKIPDFPVSTGKFISLGCGDFHN